MYALRRAVGIWVFLFLLVCLTFVRHAALWTQFGSAVPSDLGDPLLNIWILWWNAHHLPFTAAYWNAPAFAPAPYALALSETLLGLTWLTTPLQWLGASPVVAYNAMFVAIPVLNALSAYWLCLTLTRRPEAAVVGGIAYAFAPYQASQLAHIQTEATFWMPVALASLHRFWLTGGNRWLVCFAAGQIMNGLTCGYFLLYFNVLVAIVLVWFLVSTRDIRKLLRVALALVAVAAALMPVIATYRFVRDAWSLRRPQEEIERFSADLLTMFVGSDRLWLWPIHAQPWQPEGGVYPQYPGIVLTLLLIAGAVWARGNRVPSSGSTWRTTVVKWLIAASGMFLVVGGAAWLWGPWSFNVGPFAVTISHPYKPIGLSLNLLLLAAVVSDRFWALVRSGSVIGLYGTGAVAASILSLGPLGRLMGRRVWYKPPFAWLSPLPGFDSIRVPALFAAITVLCLAVVAAAVVARLLPQVGRQTSGAVAALCLLLVIDGWPLTPVVPVPPPLPTTVRADLVLELPGFDVFEDAAAMYRSMSHGRPVVNGYSGYVPPHYGYLKHDVSMLCFDSLESTRAGRSLDIIVWHGHPDSARIDTALAERWRMQRTVIGQATVYHLPRDSALLDSRPGLVDLRGDCASTRPRPIDRALPR